MKQRQRKHRLATRGAKPLIPWLSRSTGLPTGRDALWHRPAVDECLRSLQQIPRATNFFEQGENANKLFKSEPGWHLVEMDSHDGVLDVKPVRVEGKLEVYFESAALRDHVAARQIDWRAAVDEWLRLQGAHDLRDEWRREHLNVEQPCTHPKTVTQTMGDGVSTVVFCPDCGRNLSVRTPYDL